MKTSISSRLLPSAPFLLALSRSSRMVDADAVRGFTGHNQLLIESLVFRDGAERLLTMRSLILRSGLLARLEDERCVFSWFETREDALLT